MSRNKTFTDIAECVRWMLEKPGERWVRNRYGDICKGEVDPQLLALPRYPDSAPWIAVRDEHGDIPEEVKLPELDVELKKAIGCYWNACTVRNLDQLVRLVLAQAVRMSKEGK